KPPAGRAIRFRRQSRVVDAWLASLGEIFSWAESPDALPAFMAPMGFRVDRSYGSDELRLLVDKPSLGLSEGEWIADASAI
ncbi:MAG: hypothetical protein JWM35_2770, partial [Verrucomicrobia bacterium]|nr:hypothetical protein [Verrucomicrobiota bacterium]